MKQKSVLIDERKVHDMVLLSLYGHFLISKPNVSIGAEGQTGNLQQALLS
jgi:hypothetical protein